MAQATLTLVLCGDVMTGRGIDQVLPYPGDLRLHEPFVQSAVEYVRLAEQANKVLTTGCIRTTRPA